MFCDAAGAKVVSAKKPQGPLIKAQVLKQHHEFFGTIDLYLTDKAARLVSGKGDFRNCDALPRMESRGMQQLFLTDKIELQAKDILEGIVDIEKDIPVKNKRRDP